MSLIEQAAKRLEELRQAGAELPDDANASPSRSGPDVTPTPEALVRALDARAAASHGAYAARRPRVDEARAEAAVPAERAEDQSRCVELDLAASESARVRDAGRARSRRSPTSFASSSGRSFAMRWARPAPASSTATSSW